MGENKQKHNGKNIQNKAKQVNLNKIVFSPMKLDRRRCRWFGEWFNIDLLMHSSVHDRLLRRTCLVCCLISCNVTASVVMLTLTKTKHNTHTHPSCQFPPLRRVCVCVSLLLYFLVYQELGARFYNMRYMSLRYMIDLVTGQTGPSPSLPHQCK